MASIPNSASGGILSDQIVPEVEENPRNVRGKKVQESVAVIHRAFLTTLKYTTNETFRQKFLQELQATNSKQASEKLVEHLHNLSSKVHGVDRHAANQNGSPDDATPPSSGNLCAGQVLNHENNIEQEMNVSMFPSDKELSKPSTSSSSGQSSIKSKDVNWFEELLVEDSDF